MGSVPLKVHCPLTLINYPLFTCKVAWSGPDRNLSSFHQPMYGIIVPAEQDTAGEGKGTWQYSIREP